MKENFSGMRFASVDELFQGVEGFLRGLSADTIQTVRMSRAENVRCE
jgi:hypothetical protein